jgi:hypothetical protein
MHDPVTPHNFDVAITGREGRFVRATVTLHTTIPAGGIELSVLWDPERGDVVEVKPWWNLSRFVREALAAQTVGRSGH